MELVQVEFDGFAYNLSQSHRHRVANQSTNRSHTVIAALPNEFIVLGKGLEDRSFAQRDGAILRRMTEASVSKSKKLRCDGGRGLLPFHAAIDAGVRFAGFFLVAVGDKTGRPVAPSSAG